MRHFINRQDAKAPRKEKYKFLFSASWRLGVEFFACLVTALVLIVLPLPASPAVVRVESADGFDPATIKRVAFLPLVRIIPVEDGAPAVCPLSKRHFDACRIEDRAESELSRILAQELLASGVPVDWVPQAEINAARDKIKQEGGQTLAPSGALQLAIGREVKADAVLFGFIYCYRDRSGNAYASAEPAALAFCLHLVDSATGKILWSLRLRDEQVALVSDLSTLPKFFKRKGRWITVSQMAEEDAKLVAKNLPWPKTSSAGKGK